MNTMRYNFRMLLLIALGALVMISCKKEDENKDEEKPDPTTPSVEQDSIFNFLANDNGTYYLAYTNDLTQGEFSVVNNGTQLDADQAARVVASGDYLYSLDYGTGLLSQLQAQEDGSYKTTKEINAGLSVGTVNPRYKLADDNTIMVYNVTTEAVTNDNDDVTDYICTMRLASVSIPDLTIQNLSEFVIPQSENAKKGATIGYHPMRVDAPVISGNKIYFGLMHMDIFDPSTPPPFRTPKQTGLETLVFDYPSLTNGTLTQSDKASGHTGGYRGPSMHVDEKGDVYQSNWFMSANSFDLSNGDKTVIMRLKNGSYDDAYEFNVSEALGLNSNIGAVAWYYVGNGIGYMPIHLEDEGNYYSENSWTVAKVDIYNKTATKIDVPNSMLFTYENGIVHDGKFYMAIGPFGEDTYVYEFDPATTTATKGLKLDGGNIHIEGIY